MPIESAIPLSDTDRAILRALLTRVPGPASAAPRPCSESADALTSALTAAGLDELDLPLWFAQPHIQHYIRARRALDDFLDEQSTRAARREGLELLRTLPALTRAPRAASWPCSDPPDPRADASPSEPAPAARSLKELRLIATALLRAPTPARAPRTRRAKPAVQSPAPPPIQPALPTRHPAHPEDLPEDQPEPDFPDDATIEQALTWATEFLAQIEPSAPAPIAAPTHDTS
ncbi:MAG: hypothetical protein H6811_00845 [Phycisphaeraceae bacterium]|nr:hypothetical protein [Phycisphaeraceae bacterium]